LQDVRIPRKTTIEHIQSLAHEFMVDFIRALLQMPSEQSEILYFVIDYNNSDRVG